MGLVVQTAAANTPVSLAEVKLHSKIDTSADDTLVANLIEAATEWTQTWTGRQWCNATFDWTLDAFVDPHRNGNMLILPRAPVSSSVTHIKYYDTAGSQQTLSPDVYTLDNTTVPARIALKYQQSWPSLYDQIAGVEVRFVAGYSADSTSVPETARAAILMLIDHMYINRSLTMAQAIENMALCALLDPLKVEWL